MGLEDAIKKLLEEREMSQRELAEKSELSQATISRVLQGKETNLRRETLESIAEALGVTAVDLLGEQVAPEAKRFFRGYEKLSPKAKDLLKDFMRSLEKHEGQQPKRSP